MELANEVKTFSAACEHILAAVAMNRTLTTDEAARRLRSLKFVRA